MKTLSAVELKEKLDRGDEFKLVMTMGTWAFNSKYIPGSINISTPEEATKLLTPNDEIVVFQVAWMSGKEQAIRSKVKWLNNLG
jgi:hypothetical protein